MADYYVDENGNVTKKKKKKKADYSVSFDGTITKNTDDDEDEIAPVKSSSSSSESKKEKEDQKWYEGWLKKSESFDGNNTGAFDVAGDVVETAISTVADAGVGIVKGAVGSLEGITDFLSYGAGYVADWVGADGFAEKLRSDAKANTTEYLLGGVHDYFKESSVLGERSDQITSGLGQVGLIMATGGLGAYAGLGKIGVTALTSGVMGTSSAGSGTSQAYSEGATDAEAMKYGISKGVIDAGSEMIFGGLGKAVNAVGYNTGLSQLDDMFARKLSSKISNQVAKNWVEYGVKAGAEGFEEVVAGVGSAVAKKLTYADEETLRELIEDEDLLDQFIVGSVVSGMAQSGYIPMTEAGSLKEANKTGTDFITGLTTNETKVVEAEIENRIKEQEADGNKLSNKEKSKVREQVMSDLKKGYINLDTIESTLGGETFESYKSLTERENSLREEITKLQSDPRPTAKNRLTEAKAELEAIEKGTEKTELKEKLTSEVKELAKNDRLGESFNETERKKQKFEADLTRYSDKARQTVQNASEGGILNNTNRSHDVIEFTAQLSKDKGTVYDFTNNKTLEQSKRTLDNRTVDAIKIDDETLVVNVSSGNYLNAIVGHDISDTLNGTKESEQLKETLKNFVGENEYNKRKSELEKLYSDADVNIESVLTATLVSENLNNSEFIKTLSKTSPSVFKKVYSEIKHLSKLAPAGSRESNLLDGIVRDFKKSSAESSQTTADDTDDMTIKRQSKIISELTQEEISDKTYAVLDRLGRGESVTPSEIEGLKEVKEGMEKTEELLDKFIAENPQFKGVDKKDVGTYLLDSDERIQLRERIIAERLKEGSFSHIDSEGREVYNGEVKKDKRLDIVIGLPASGKSSSIVNPLSEYYKSAVIDSDIIKTKLPEFNEGWGAGIVHEESSLMNAQLLEESMNLGNNIVLPIVGSKVKSVEKYLAVANKMGYEVNVHLNELSNSKAVGRMLRRYFSEGRFINPTYALAYGNKPTEVFDQIKQRSDISGYSKWSNDVERGKRPELIEVSDNNRLYGTYSESWRPSRGEVSGRVAGETGETTNTNQIVQNNRGDGYVRTDEFRRIQEESRGMSEEDTQSYWNGSKEIDDGLRGRLSGSVKRILMDSRNNGGSNGGRVLELNAKGSQFNIHENVDGSLFHDVFEIARKHLENGELVDLHGIETTEDGIGYNDTYNYLSEDGLSGFSITPDGDLISVFNASGKRGFLRAIAPVVKEKAKTLDCYASQRQNLQGMYEKIFGFKTASIMDYNMEYDHDNIAQNHGDPQVAFMVNTDAEVETKHFTKDQYDEAFDYRNSFVDNTNNQIAPVNEAPNKGAFFDAPIRDSSEIDAQQGDRLNTLDESQMPEEVEAPYYETEDFKVEDPFADRDIKEVGKRNVNAYMYDNPEVRPFYQAEARGMLRDLKDSIKGERQFNDHLYYETGGEKGWFGNKRFTTPDIEYLLDEWGYSYAEIEKGLNAIIEDHGAENIAVAKRIEFLIDEKLRNGYTDFFGNVEVPPNQEYLDLLADKQMNEYQDEAYNQYLDSLAQEYASQEVAPVRQQYEAIEPAPRQQGEAIQPAPQEMDAQEQEWANNKMARVKDPNSPTPHNVDVKQRRWVETSTESEVVNREILPDDLELSKIVYEPIPNKVTLSKANTKLDTLGYDDALTYFNSQLASKKTTLEDIALGERLLQEAMKKGDTATAGELIQNIAILGTELGQKVQALSIIQRLTPEGQLKMLQKTVNRGKVKGDKAYEGVVITQEMIDHILKTYKADGTFDQNELNGAVEDVKKQIAKNMKVTAIDKVNAWRYLSMLGNPKTHIRNLVSNVAMRGTTAVKNVVARTIEDVAPVKNQTKTWKRATNEVKDFAKKTTIEMKNVISDDSKYSEDSSIKSQRDMFKNKILNKVYNLNSDLLMAEDWWFSKPAYKNSLSEYLTANGIKTNDDIKNNPKIVEKAKQYALEQSQIATFRQYSWLANKMREIESKNIATEVAVGSVLPFKKTPVNIARAGLNYSPLGFAKTLTYDVAQVKKGNMEASTLIDHLAQNMTGTALTLAGYFLASLGFINGGGDDDKEGSYDYQLGKQGYSINIGGNSYSLSWLSPVAMPLFVGANAYEQLVEGEEWNGDVVVQTLAETLDPLSEMSFMSSLDSVLSSYDSGVQKFAGIGETMLQSYLGQFIPTASSQLASTLDDTKRSTQVAGDSGFKAFDETVNKLKYKIPILRETLEPTTDIWGNEVKQNENVLGRAFESFIAPYSRKDSVASEIDEEIKELYAQTGEDGIIPKIPEKSVNYDGEKYKMSAKEYTDYKKTYGQTANDMLEDLFKTTTYQNATSEDRADMVKKVYEYASDEAKKEYLEKEGVDYTNAKKDGVEYYKENKIKGAIENDMSLEEFDLFSRDEGKYYISKTVGGYESYKTYTNEMNDISADKDNFGNSISGSRKRKVIEYINSIDADYGAKLILFKSEYPADDTYNNDIIEYLNNRDDITYAEMESILKALGFTVDANGNVRW